MRQKKAPAVCPFGGGFLLDGRRHFLKHLGNGKAQAAKADTFVGFDHADLHPIADCFVRYGKVFCKLLNGQILLLFHVCKVGMPASHTVGKLWNLNNSRC